MIEDAGFLLLKMTIKQARKTLGKLAQNLTNEQLEEEIQTAVFLAELLMQHYSKKLKVKQII